MVYRISLLTRYSQALMKVGFHKTKEIIPSCLISLTSCKVLFIKASIVFGSCLFKFMELKTGAYREIVKVYAQEWCFKRN